ncbi:hypothetical protein LCGC14_0930960 [marine sediment metagenome]|uniref:Uncharacterized protein n=1 Tax=marine sediment metagenome TaxID=412755 RepID=A0A0F9P8X0_9ZZZZ
MVAAVFHGKGAKAWWGSTGYTEFVNVVEWSATITADVAESHAMHASSYGKTREVGFKAGTARVVCKLPGDAVVDEGTSITLELWRTSLSAAKGYSGAAICIGVEAGVDMNDIEVITYNFQFTSTIANTLGAV